MRYWLLKTEPSSFSIDDLAQKGTSIWDGVRNYQARNYLKEVKRGDVVLIHHSSIAEPAVVGFGTVKDDTFPDPTQFDKKSNYFDPKASKEKPRWFTHTISFKEKFKNPVTLSVIKKHPKLQDMMLVHRGRLSVQPIEEKEFKEIVRLAKSD